MARVDDRQIGVLHDHPSELVKLRHDLGLPRHPAQIVVSEKGNIDVSSRVFSTPGCPVFLLAGERGIEKTAEDLRARPWITAIPIEGNLPAAILRLRRDHGVSRISAVGGRTLATSLVDAGLVQDIYRRPRRSTPVRRARRVTPARWRRNFG